MIDEYIKETLKSNFIVSIPIELLPKEQLKKLTEKAKENNILVTLKAEYSNAHQGVLVGLIKKDIAINFLTWL